VSPRPGLNPSPGFEPGNGGIKIRETDASLPATNRLAPANFNVSLTCWRRDLT